MIEVNNLTTNLVDEKFLKKIGGIVLKGERKGKVDLSIALVGRKRIRELNRKYRGKNQATDILAFPESKVFLEQFKTASLKKIQSLGEIVICLREVRKNAKRFSSTFETELAQVLIHGILHLLGYNHEISKKKVKEMEKKQKYYLEVWQKFIL